MTRVPIHFPLGGVSDDQAFSQQEAGTTSDADNVGGIDPITGRTRGGQRAGMSKHITTSLNGANKVQDIVVVTRDSPKIDWANLAPPIQDLVRQTAEGSTVHWVALDVSENVYILDGQSAITKYNSDGVKLRTIPIPVPEGHTVVKKIVVDADGGVYAASAKLDNSEGRVWRFRDSSVNGLELDLAWEHEIAGSGVEMIASDLYSVTLAVIHQKGARDRSLLRLDSVITGTPSETVVADIPGPVNALEIDGDGAIKVSIGANAARGANLDVPGFTKGENSTDLWNPHDLNNAEQRIYFWLDATDVDGDFNASLSDGVEIERWEDRRQRNTTDGLGTYTPVEDTTPRPMFRDTTEGGRPGPLFRDSIFGDLPGVHFDASTPTTGTLTGAALQTHANKNATIKATASSLLPSQRALFPGTTNAKFMTFIVFKPKDSQRQSILFGQRRFSGAQDYAIFVNAQPEPLTGAAPWRPVWEFRKGIFHNKNGTSITGALFNNEATTTSQPAPFSYDNLAGAVILTIVHNATGVGNESVIRANGVPMDNFAFEATTSFSVNDASATVFGCRRRLVPENPSLDLYLDADTFQGADPLDFAALESFDGYVAEILTIHADSSVGLASGDTHDSRIVLPVFTAGGIQNNTGTVSQWEAARLPDLATEVERIEGYLAHKWGLSHLLQNGFGNFEETAEDLLNHPFGGTGSWPISPASGDMAAALEAQGLWKPDPVLARFAPGTSNLSWTLSGGGMGHTSKTSEDGFVFTMGAKKVSTGLNNWGPDYKSQTDRIGMCVRDRGARSSMNRPARGIIAFRDNPENPSVSITNHKQPSVGTSVTIDDGLNAPVTFTYVASGAVLPQVNLGGSALGSMINLRVAINNGAVTLDVTAISAGPHAIALTNDADGTAGNAAIATNAPTEIEVFGMGGGETLTGVWNLTDATFAPDKAGLGVDVDEEGDFWVPRLTSNVPQTVQKLGKLDGVPITSYSVNPLQSIASVALPLSHPAYIDQSPTPTGPVFMYLGTSGGELDPQIETLHKVRLVSETQNLGGTTTARATRTLAVSGGNVYELDASADSASLVPGATLAPLSPFIFSAVLFNKVFWCDGAGYTVYDSQLNTLEPMTSKAAGSLPTNGRLIETWRGRLLIARTEDDPHNVHMSRIGDPFNWDEFPVIADSLEAVSLGNSRVGRSSDIINGIIPYNDDLLIIGGDHTIQLLAGDPTGGGQLDLVSDITGMAYGRAWAKDPEGRVYFFGSRGGVYMMAPGGVPTRITRDRIERRMAEVDLADNQIRLAWDYRREGLIVQVVPSGQPTLGASPASSGWFLEKTGAWWPLSQVRTNEAPTALAVLDGDLPADRVVLMGGGDGFVRKVDETAVNDDGQRIVSSVLIGPLAPSEMIGQLKFMRPQFSLGALQSGCDYEFFASDIAELPGVPVSSGHLNPGQNPTLPIRARGAFIWIRLFNGAVDQRWAYERGSVDVVPGGIERVR